MKPSPSRRWARRIAIPLFGLLVAGLVFSGCGGSPTGGVIPPPTGSVTLLDVQVQVFTPRCALSGCHTGTAAPFGLDLGAGLAAGNIVNVDSAEVPTLKRVEPFDAANSYLYMKVIGDPRIEGDPMPLNASPLSAGNLALLETWINEGAN